ncbi:MAG: efflux RND transporter periplasmic adaptor subunit [Rhodoferax sp.]
MTSTVFRLGHRSGVLPSALRAGLSIGLLLAGLSGWAQSNPVPTLAVQSRASGSAYELEGVIQPVKQSTIATQASGRIVALLVRAGDKVRSGQLLATIDDRDAVAGLQRSQAQVTQAEAELRNAQAQWERTRDLQSKGFVSIAALDVADAQLKSASAVREQASAAARQSGIAQGFTRVLAPYDGWVMQTHAEAGDLALPGKPLLTVYAPQPLRAVVQVPASRSRLVRDAAQTQVQVDDASGATRWLAPVARSAVPAADPVSQTTEWRLELPTKDSAMLVPGQQVRVRFAQPTASAESRLLLPEAAIVRRGELTAVYVVTGNTFALRAVRLGAGGGSEGVEVQAGLSAGELVALEPVRAAAPQARPAAPGK